VYDYWLLIRPRILALSLFAMGTAAYTVGSGPPPWPTVLHALAGTTLVIAGAMALNQRLEGAADARMPRPAARPLPAGRLGPRRVVLFGAASSVAGFAYLGVLAPMLLVGLAVASWGLYVGVYTPLKSRSPWQTPVGAAAGAMPALLGASLTDDPFGPTAWTLLGVVFLWQFPHSMAIGWLYRDQFAAAGVKLATVTDPTGRTAGALAAATAAALPAVALLPSMLGRVGWGYGLCSLVLGAGYLWAAILFLRTPDDRTARRLLRVSIAYLPLLLGSLLLVR
jgi:protoheme IX farnesyltransferase